MLRIILLVSFGIILFILLYDIYKTRKYNKPRQIIWAIVGALLLAYILYTCHSDSQYSLTH